MFVWLGGLIFNKAQHDSVNYFVLSEVLLDPCRTWCPSSTCQAVCQLKEADSPALPQLVQCAVCALEFCSSCKAQWHPGQACQEHNLPITSFLPGENRYNMSISTCVLSFNLHYSDDLQSLQMSQEGYSSFSYSWNEFTVNQQNK